MTAITGNNQQLADQLRQDAGTAMLRRKILLVTSVALAETSTVQQHRLEEQHESNERRAPVLELQSSELRASFEQRRRARDLAVPPQDLRGVPRAPRAG